MDSMPAKKISENVYGRSTYGGLKRDSLALARGKNDYAYKWSLSDRFDESVFDLKEKQLSELNKVFVELKAKRKLEKSINSAESLGKNVDKKSNVGKTLPLMETHYDDEKYRRRQDSEFSLENKFFSLEDDSETEDEEIDDLSFRINVNDRKLFIPKKLNCTVFDVCSDGFDITPEFLEVLPKSDPQAVILTKRNLELDSLRFKKLKKRKFLSLVVDTLFHKWDADYVPDKKLSDGDLGKRKKIRYEFSRVAFKDIVKTEIKREYNRYITEFDLKMRLSKTLADSAVSILRRRYQIPSSKDTLHRARKVVYEMQTYWRKVDRESHDTRKRKTSDVISERKKIHSIKEVKRQSQRLEFLLRQTEIFSHFIGARMGMKQVPTAGEKSSDGVAESSLVDGSNLKMAPVAPMIGNFGDDKKAAKAAIEFMSRRKKETLKFEQKLVEESGNTSYIKSDAGYNNQINEMSLLNPSLMPSKTNIKEPALFHGKLKSYQLKGLNWLVNLYDHSINGILADEMGLGKTIQSIAFIAHLCEVENLWGPYLVIAPNSVVHNWCYEFEQFTPGIKVFPYWGAQKDRETLRRFWKPQFLYSSEGNFHVMVTSYSTFQTDERHFKKMKWQFIILDEAHAIKNSSSQRWKSLLSLECRNRILLTGTPIQNSMAELWSLLHYIMPSIFQKHKEFKEWFSKNIEDHAEGKSGKLNSVQLNRLHMILKPFMLRRIKMDVEHEMAPKKEVVIKCDLSSRQKKLYAMIKAKLKEDTSLMEEEIADKDIYNLVMQFRKLCNHPDIYKKRINKTPFFFGNKSSPGLLLSSQQREFFPHLNFLNENPIHFKVPRTLFDEKISSENFCFRNFGIYHAENVNKSISMENSEFSFLKFSDLSVAEFEFLSQTNGLFIWLSALQKAKKRIRGDYYRVDGASYEVDSEERGKFDKFEIKRMLLLKRGFFDGSHEILKPNLGRKIVKESPKFIFSAFQAKCQAAPIRIKVSRNQRPCLDNFEKSLLIGTTEAVNNIDHLVKISSRSLRAPPSLPLALNPIAALPKLGSAPKNVLFDEIDVFGSNRSQIEVFPKNILLTDCGKLKALDNLLTRKRENNHRVLIFSQMTKMLDILGDYCQFRNYTYLRLDGSTQITDRTIMVKKFQRDESIFIFLLSTRAGGLGINLTAADTVIFYDNDWNPTMDAQAMDRVHRIGQKKQVTVYRIICRNTVEERVWRVAQQKYKIQKSVYSGGFRFAKEMKRLEKGKAKRKPKKGEADKKSKKLKVDEVFEEKESFKPSQFKKLILEDER